jgi:hypothetical protein
VRLESIRVAVARLLFRLVWLIGSIRRRSVQMLLHRPAKRALIEAVLDVCTAAAINESSAS